MGKAASATQIFVFQFTCYFSEVDSPSHRLVVVYSRKVSLNEAQNTFMKKCSWLRGVQIFLGSAAHFLKAR